MIDHPSAVADPHEERQGGGSRRREAPDWGGDELFTTTPRRRRYDRPSRGHHPADHLDRSHGRDTTEHPLQGPVARRAAIKARPKHPLEIPPALDPGRTAPPRVAPPNARRTVTITGHPEGALARRRPAPTLDERFVGSSPDRVAAYAVALGMLLVVIAYLTANA